jgi:GAF domain-containing protein
MKRRSRAGGKASKARGREALNTKRRDASKNAPSSAPIRDAEVARLTRELGEALEQQAATSEVLRLINNSPGDLQPVFDTTLENAARICDATFGLIYRWDGDALHLAATYNTPTAFAEARRWSSIRPDPNLSLGRMVATKTTVHVADAAAEEAYADQRHPSFVAAVELGGVRTYLFVPMIRRNDLIGLFALYRQEVRPFSDKQIDLVKNFAAQAVIAIENARLLNELSQSLEQQTATAEVLQVVSSSLGDLEPVFATMLEKAVRICDATFGNIYRWDGEALHLVATHNTPPAFAEARRRSPHRRDGRNQIVTSILATKTPVHVVDAAAQPGYIDRSDLAAVQSVELGGVRTLLAVPMLKEGELIGGFTVYRKEVRPFSDKQIELVKNFAAQAVIAIENARLLNELRQRTTDLTERTADLTEALEQQTATSEVLQVISGSAGDLEPVFASMLENAVRICEAKFGIMNFPEPSGFRPVAMHNVPEAFAEFIRRDPVVHFAPKHPLARAAATKQVLHIPDLELYADDDAVIAKFRELTGARTILHVPMLKDEQLVGIVSIYRQQVRPFADKQIDLVKNFAAQAVIAIENARLLKELRERTDEVEKLNQQLEHRVADQVGEIERMSRLRRFLPPQVADLIVASGTEKQLESHRREITALFCDLRGFTGFTESADAEDVMALLRDYHAAIGEIIIKYNGTLERYAGDGVMVVFNDPVPVENPALQAVLMALEVREAIGVLTATWSRLGHEIGFGIGIAHGFATLGTIGFEGRFDYAAIGTVSNVASRLCDEAKPGQILISPRVLMKVENAVKVEPVGEFELKGIRRPLAAYNVVGATSVQT